MTTAPLVFTAAQREQLDALLPELRPVLEGAGVSREWLMERTGISGRFISQWLHEQGAKRAGAGLWRLPNVRRLRDTLNPRVGFR